MANARTSILAAMLVLFGMATVADAQPGPPMVPRPNGLPSAPLQTTLPSASLPTPPAGPLDTSGRPPGDLFRAGSETYAPRFDQLLPIDPRFFPCCGVFPGPYVAPYPLPWPATDRQQRLPERYIGYVRLFVQPGLAQVLVDGYYIGTVDDLRGLLRLDAGPHRIELRAPGYRTTTFDMRVMGNDTVSYRSDLEAVASTAATTAPGQERPAQNQPTQGQPTQGQPTQGPPAQATPKTIYVIANCYAGDRPPVRSTLPASCRGAAVRAIPPE